MYKKQKIELIITNIVICKKVGGPSIVVTNAKIFCNMNYTNVFERKAESDHLVITSFISDSSFI